MTTARTRLVALLGHPVGHSISPQLHSAAFAAAGIDATYLAFDVVPDRLADAVRALRDLGALGANVTVPHKRAVEAHLDGRTREAEHVGAVNTIVRDGQRLLGDNTDAEGLGEVLQRDIGITAGDAVLLFGAGGAARAAAVALGRLGVRLEVVARREAAALEVSALARRVGAQIRTVGDPRLVVNATPLGLLGEALPDRFMRLGAGQIALDLIYGRAQTPFLRAAFDGGATAVDGLPMLIAQAARAFERWTGQPAPLEVMRRAALDALA